MKVVYKDDIDSLRKRSSSLIKASIITIIIYLVIFIPLMVLMNRNNLIYHMVSGLIISLIFSIIFTYLFFYKRYIYKAKLKYLQLSALVGKPITVEVDKIDETTFYKNCLAYNKIFLTTDDKHTLSLDVLNDGIKNFEINSHYRIWFYSSTLFMYERVKDNEQN